MPAPAAAPGPVLAWSRAMTRPFVTLATLALVFVLALAPDGRSDGPAGPPPPAASAQVTSRVSWLLAQQRKDGGFGRDPARRVQTTAIVVLGLADRRLGDEGRRAALGRAIDHLIARQDEAGAFREEAPGKVDRTLLGLLALFAYQEDDGSRRSAGLALLGEGVAAAISAAPPGTPADPTDDELVRVALTLTAP